MKNPRREKPRAEEKIFIISDIGTIEMCFERLQQKHNNETLKLHHIYTQTLKQVYTVGAPIGPIPLLPPQTPEKIS